MTQQPKGPTPPPDNFIIPLTVATACGSVNWTTDKNGSLSATGGDVMIELAVINELPTLTMTSGPGDTFVTNSETFPEISALYHFARDHAEARLERINHISNQFYEGIPAREIPNVEDDPSGIWRLIAAAAHATDQDHITWNRTDSPGRVTILADVPNHRLQLDLLHNDHHGDHTPLLVFTLTSGPRIIAVTDERRPNLRDGWPLLKLLQAANTASRRRRISSNPHGDPQHDPESPPEFLQLNRLAHTFLNAIS